jgi:hypothetical protein
VSCHLITSNQVQLCTHEPAFILKILAITQNFNRFCVIKTNGNLSVYIIPGSRALPLELTFAQLKKKFGIFYETRTSITVLTRVSYWNLSWATLIQYTLNTTYLYEIHFNTFVSSMRRFSKLPYSFRFPTKVSCAFLIPLMRVTYLAQSLSFI